MIRPRFSLRTLFVAVTVPVVVFLWHFKTTRDQQRQVCDQAIATTLSNVHWKNLDSTQVSTFTSALSNSFNQQSLCRTSFLLPSGAFSDGTTADAFETGLLTDWSKVTNNGAQLAETATRGTLLESFTYYKAIRADQKSCVICHTDPASISPMKIGHIIAIAKTIYGN